MALSNKELAELSQEVSPLSFIEYRDFLAQAFTALKKIKDGYSYLQFAEDLGFSHTNVIHLIIRGKRPLTNKAAAKIASALKLQGKESEYFESLVAHANCRSPDAKDQILKRLLTIRENASASTNHKFHIEFLSEWYHPVIREMCFLPDFQSDGGWIADHISPRIRPEQARKSLILLENLGLIRFDKGLDKHVPVQNRVTSGDEIDDLAVIRYHHAMIDLGKASISGVDEKERDIGAITFSADDETAALIKREVQAFRKKILALAEGCKSPGRIYQMNAQYFPVTRSGRGAAK